MAVVLTAAPNPISEMGSRNAYGLYFVGPCYICIQKIIPSKKKKKKHISLVFNFPASVWRQVACSGHPALLWKNILTEESISP